FNATWVSWAPRQGTPWSNPIRVSQGLRTKSGTMSAPRVGSDGRSTWVAAWEAEVEADGKTQIALARVALVTPPSIGELARRLGARLPDGSRSDRVAKSLGHLERKLLGQARKVDASSGRQQHRASRMVRALTGAILGKARNAAGKDRLGVDLEPIEAAAMRLL